MLVDLQGSGCKLFDPEIASKELFDEENKFLYCTGNLSELAISNFIAAHTCNTFCRLVGLMPLAHQATLMEKLFRSLKKDKTLSYVTDSYDESFIISKNCFVLFHKIAVLIHLVVATNGTQKKI